jgi:hypothetical protein
MNRLELGFKPSDDGQLMFYFFEATQEEKRKVADRLFLEGVRIAIKLQIKINEDMKNFVPLVATAIISKIILDARRENVRLIY